MPKLAYIFPGQGSQYVGMGKDLATHSPLAREIFEQADSILGFPLSRICFDGPEEELRQTQNTQPAIFLHSIVLTRLLEPEGIAMSAGHSLGEYTALVLAGSLTFEDGLKLVRRRGELMQRAGEEWKGTMAAIVGLEAGILEQICRDASSEGVVQCANFNSPGQIVISGSLSGVRRAMEIAKSQGARLVKELVVSGAFHSPLMQGAQEGLTEALSEIPLRDAKIPVYTNVSARPAQNAGKIRTLLQDQLTSPVHWEESIKNMIDDGATMFLEVGPGKVLQGLVKRIDPSVEVRGIDRFEDLGKLIPA